MRVRLSVFVFGAAQVAGQLGTPPIDAYPTDTAQCASVTGTPGNLDLCIQCYSCTYLLDSDGQEGGANCLEGPWDQMDTPLVFKRYCSGSASGVNNDFENLACGEDEQLYEVKCAATSLMRSSNTYWNYILTRQFGSVREGTDIGAPGAGGIYALRSLKDVTVKCDADNCNDVDIISGRTTAETSTKAQIQCKECSYNSVLNEGDPNCLNGMSEIASTTCADDQICTITVQNDLVFITEDGSSQFIERGCANGTMSGIRPETEARQQRWTVCEGDLCNVLGVNVDPDDVSPIPPPGAWDEALTDAEAAIFCGPMLENCIRCYDCQALDSEDPFQPCVTFPSEGELKFYRRRYYDMRTETWVNNKCATDVREFVSESISEIDGRNAVVRMARQYTDDELNTDPEEETMDADLTFCKGKLCNDVNINDVSSHEPGQECFYCKADNTDDTNPCVTGQLSVDADLTEPCPTSVCQLMVSDTETTRGCLKLPLVAAAIRGGTNATMRSKILGCFEDQCNDNYVDIELNILENRPDFVPVKVPAPVDISLCNDTSLGYDNTNLCIECYTCEAVVNHLDNPEWANFTQCITDFEDTKQYYFRFQGGFPVMCGVSTERSKSTNGYFYNIERGAIADVDPAQASGQDELKILTHRTSKVHCQDDSCNIYPFNDLPLPPAISPRAQARANSCFECSATSAEVLGENGEEAMACFENPTNTVACTGPNDKCFVSLTELWDITNDLYSTDMEIERGCEQFNMDNAIDSQVLAKDIWVCKGDACNNQEETDMPPYDDVEIPDVIWAEPLPLDQADILCTSFPCIECLTCLYLYEFDDAYPRDYPCSSRRYRQSFINPDSPQQLLYNHCASRTGLREHQYIKKRYINHGVEQSISAPNPDAQVTSGYTGLTSTSNGQCESCTSRGNCQAIPDTVDCPANVCRELIVGEGVTERKGCALPAEVEDFSIGIRNVTYQEQWKLCNTDNCNIMGGNNYTAEAQLPVDEPAYFPFPGDAYPGIDAEFNTQSTCQNPDNPNPDNRDYCITCYTCTYTYDSDGNQAAQSCSNTNPGTERREVFQYYCHPAVPEAGFGGVNNDFNDLRCAESQTMAKVWCAATADLISENDYYIYLLTRKFVVVREDVDLGVPEFGGYYNVEDVKEGDVFCVGNDCNSVELQQPVANTKTERETGWQSCKTCSYSRFTNPLINPKNDGTPHQPSFGDPACLESIDDVDSGLCATDETCTFKLTQTANNFDGLNQGLRQKTQTLTRGCRRHDMLSNRPETMLKQRRTSICDSSLCNNREQEIDPEDVGPLPRPGRWDQPIAQSAIGIFCGEMGSECKQCYTCTAEVGDNFDICRNKAEYNPSLTYRNRYFDERRDIWVNNICSVTTAYLLPGNAKAVSRGVVQLSDQEVNEINNEFLRYYNEENDFCTGDLCNGLGRPMPSSVNRCYYCRSKSNTDDDQCWSGQFGPDAPMEQCPTGVCITIRSQTQVSRACALDETVVKQALEVLDNITDNIVTVLTEGIREVCVGNNCNTQYVNTDNEILPGPPVYNPSEVTVPVSPQACDDPNIFGPDTDLCFKCHFCSHIVDSNTNDYTTCITDPGETAYFFKAEAGIPSVCAVRTEKILTETGYKYFVRRGAVQYLDPTLVNNIGPTKIQTYRETDYNCLDGFCNGLPLDKIPIPPIVGPQVASPQRTSRSTRAVDCFTCMYSEVTGEGDPNCLTAPSETVTCGEDEVCHLNLIEEFTISDAPILTTDVTIDRGCHAQDMHESVFTIGMRKIDTWVCRGDLCNMGTSEPELPPYDPLPTDADRWTQPLSESDARICEFTDCKVCLTCEEVYLVDEPYPVDYQCDERRYKSYFVNEQDASSLKYNHCSVRSGIRETGVIAPTRFITHLVTQSDTEEPLLDSELKMGIIRLLAASTKSGTCPVCSNEQECATTSNKVCNSDDDVCREYEENGAIVSRGCASRVEALLFKEGATVITEQVQVTACEGENCNSPGLEEPYLPDPMVPVTGPSTSPTVPPTSPTVPSTTPSSAQSMGLHMLLAHCFIIFIYFL